MTLDTILFAAIFSAIFAVLWRLHRDVEALRRTMFGDADSLRRDMRGSMEALRRDMRGNMEALRRDVGEVSARLAKVEGMLMGAGLRARLDA